MSDRPIEEIVASVAEMQIRLKALEAAVKVEKNELWDRLEAGSAQTASWVFGGTTVTRVKGRVTRTLDRAKLVLAGVTQEVLEAATRETVGSAYLRISPTTVAGESDTVEE